MNAPYVMRDRNVFPAAKWAAYMESCKTLAELLKQQNEILMLTMRLNTAVAEAENEVAEMRGELLEAIEGGAAIEHGGRIVSRKTGT